MGERTKISVARFSEGVTLRVEGPGTMSESRVVHAFAERVLTEPPRESGPQLQLQLQPQPQPEQQTQRVIIDLADCTYLDSTFLGGLVSLLKRHGGGVSGGRAEGGNGRFAIYAPPEKRRLLFSVSRLDQLLPFVPELPASSGDTDLSLEALPHASKEELGLYIVECHRRLAELGGSEAQDFRRVADALETELRTPTSTRS
jgi:hypothetical protein